MRYVSLGLVGLSLCGLSACGSGYVFDQAQKVKDKAWLNADSLTFSFEIPDTQSLYNVYLELQHRPDYAFSNVYCQFRVTFPQGQPRQDVISLDLADEMGNWKGECGSSSCRQRFVFLPRTKFAQQGQHTIAIRQFTRMDSLQGVEGMRLQIEKIVQP